MKRTCVICGYRDGDGRGDIVAIDSPTSDPLRVTCWCWCPNCGCRWQTTWKLGEQSHHYVVHVGEVTR